MRPRPSLPKGGAIRLGAVKCVSSAVKVTRWVRACVRACVRVCVCVSQSKRRTHTLPSLPPAQSDGVFAALGRLPAGRTAHRQAERLAVELAPIAGPQAIDRGNRGAARPVFRAGGADAHSKAARVAVAALLPLRAGRRWQRRWQRRQRRLRARAVGGRLVPGGERLGARVFYDGARRAGAFQTERGVRDDVETTQLLPRGGDRRGAARSDRDAGGVPEQQPAAGARAARAAARAAQPAAAVARAASAAAVGAAAAAGAAQPAAAAPAAAAAAAAVALSEPAAATATVARPAATSTLGAAGGAQRTATTTPGRAARLGAPRYVRVFEPVTRTYGRIIVVCTGGWGEGRERKASGRVRQSTQSVLRALVSTSRTPVGHRPAARNPRPATGRCST